MRDYGSESEAVAEENDPKLFTGLLKYRFIIYGLTVKGLPGRFYAVIQA